MNSGGIDAIGIDSEPHTVIFPTEYKVDMVDDDAVGAPINVLVKIKLWGGIVLPITSKLPKRHYVEGDDATLQAQKIGGKLHREMNKDEGKNRRKERQILYLIKSSFLGKAGLNKKQNKDQDLPPELILATGQEVPTVEWGINGLLSGEKEKRISEQPR